VVAPVWSWPLSRQNLPLGTGAAGSDRARWSANLV